LLDVDTASAIRAGQLASVYRDPFDRLVGAQALVLRGAVVTNDTAFADLGIEVFWQRAVGATPSRSPMFHATVGSDMSGVENQDSSLPLALRCDHGHIFMTTLPNTTVPPRSTRPRHTPTVPAVSASTFKATCLELMDDIARTGTEIIVTKHGRPVVRVSAVATPHESPWGFLAGSVVRHGDIVSADEPQWTMSATDPLAPRRRR
jgi:prevent-host-death family protein